MLEFRLLGPLEAIADGRPLRLGPPQQRALLAALVLRAGSVVSVDSLIDAVWGDRPPESAANIVQSYVARLRRLLEPQRARGEPARLLLTRPPGYVLALQPDQTDAGRFCQLVEAGRRARPSDPATAAAALRDALALWRGDVLADLRDVAAATSAHVRLTELRRTALDERIEADLALGRDAELVPELEALLADDPLRERTCGQLMVALYRSGRQADALAAYDAARRTLADELGLDPGPELRALEAAILRQDLASAPARQPNRSVSGILPAQLTSFVGREDDLAGVRALLRDRRLVTLTGAAGSGKTRLAVEVAGGEFAGETYLVDLVPVTEPQSLPSAVAMALGVREEPGRPVADTLTDYLRSEHVLIVLDNCEHLVEACAAFVGALLRACPAVHILATSRQALGVVGEVIWPVPGLAEPAAVRLFAERAAAPLLLSAETAPVVQQICRRLDGMPLAIELAAARTRMLSVSEIAVRLDDRFGLLGPANRGGPARHRTLSAAIDWSYELLPEAERGLFDRLSVFAGGFGLAAAEAVAGPGDDVMELLGQLVDKSLLLRAEGVDGLSRYRLLDTLRQYGRDRLVRRGAAEEVRRRHAAHYAELAEELSPLAPGPAVPKWLDRFEEERANLHSAATWASGVEAAEPASAIISGAWLLWLLRGPLGEGRELVEAALRDDGRMAPPIRARLLYGAAAFALAQGDLNRATEAGRECFAVSRGHGHDGGAGWGLACQGLAAWARGDYESGRTLTEQAVAAARRAGDRWHAAMGLAHLGRVAADQGDAERAGALLEESVALAHEVDQPVAVGFALDLLATLAYRDGRHSRAAALAEQALWAYRAGGSPQELIGSALRTIGLVAFRRGDHERAAAVHLERLALCRRLGIRGSVTACLEDLADVAAARDQPVQAAHLLAAAEAMRSTNGTPIPGPERDHHHRRLAAVRAVLDEQDFAAAWTAGKAMTLDSALNEAKAVGAPAD
ncbi:MAG TPA: BTAD domain-containing putative transcriptional regulator [Pseudonocardiaceae bacterium]|nr:BTAD domain-containing putative transcriptional regulator [Pseudonocardiaceae bacterium]